ncbi:MAG: discoidin domain-containing protein, partial [Armatimonadetes bacterium]|nr:discoidin domain-containing protein [Armatimonadota bacterium]
IEGAFSPEYLRHGQGAALALDDRGGLGIFVLEEIPVHPRVEQSRKAFRMSYGLSAPGDFLLCVCPPREYDWKRDRADRIVHFFPSLIGPDPGFSDNPLPTNEELARWREFCNVLVLHLETWNGYQTARPQARDEKRLREVLALARKLGYRRLIYASPIYFAPAYEPGDYGGRLRDNAVDLFLDHATWMIETYDLDGIYWDGLFMDLLKAWDCARRMRQILGPRLLYYHNTFFPLTPSDWGVYPPFVDTYADYMLRGESFDRRRVDPIYLRYEVSGHNISNAIGTLCYDGCRIDEAMVDWCLEANVRIPYWPGAQVLGGRKYFLTPEEDRIYREYYIPAEAKIGGPEDYEKLARAGRARREARRQELEALQRQREAALREYLRAQKVSMTPQQRENLAALRPVLWSDYTNRGEQMHGLGYRPEYVNDLNPETIWGADRPPAQWVAVDLGRTETISRVRVINYHADRRYYHYRVEVSTDGRTWRKIGEKLDNELATAEGNTFAFEPLPARYVRVLMLYNSANVGLHVGELEVYR